MSAIALLCARRIATAVAVCALQALLAAIALALSGPEPLLAACLAVACNGVAIPLALRRMPHQSAMPPVIAHHCGAVASWLAVVVLLLAAMAIFSRLGPGDALALGASVVLLGLLLVVQGSHPLAPSVGLLSSQNGCLLVASAIPGLPLEVLLVIALPLVPAMALADAWLRQ